MRVLLVTVTDLLPFVLMKVLNPALEYCAIVVDEVEKAKNMLANVPPIRDKIFPIYELKECIENYHYDFLIYTPTDWNNRGTFANAINKYKLDKNKVLELFQIHTPENFLVERALRYYKNHATEFEMVSIGMSYLQDAIVPQLFKKKIFNFGIASQDLYYDYQIAKFVFAQSGGVGTCPLKYALIGLAPFSFHYDLSKSLNITFRMLQYSIAFNDFHNFHVPIEKYKSLFNPEYLNIRLTIELEIDSVFSLGQTVTRMTLESRVSARNVIDDWKDKNFPETVKENIKIFDEYLTLCEKNNVRPIIFLPPMTQGYIKHFNRHKLDEFYCLVREAQKKHPKAVFFDGWKLPPFSDDNFFDVQHLNIQGAVKFSAIFNNFVEQLER